MKPHNPPGLQVPELLEQIVEFLHDDREALQSCATSSRILTSVAQRHLFCAITSFPTQAHYIAPGRLRAILADSPHLAPLIRRVDLNLNTESDAELAGVGLSHVQELGVWGMAGGGKNIHEPTLDTARRLIGSQLVQRVELMGSYRDMRLLGRLFGDCTPHLQEVVFKYVFVKQTLGDGDLPYPAVSQAVRTRLTRLALLSSNRLIAWLVNEDCPFDISHLVDVDVSGSLGIHKHTQPLLERARLTIQRLRFSMALVHPAHGGPFIDLTRFPTLTHVTVNTPMGELPNILPAMAKLDPHNNIREVVFAGPAIGAPGEQFEAMLREFDSAFAAFPLPALERVEIQVQKSQRSFNTNLTSDARELNAEMLRLAQHSGVADRQKTAALLRECLPVLSSKRLLIITEGEDRWHSS